MADPTVQIALFLPLQVDDAGLLTVTAVASSPLRFTIDRINSLVPHFPTVLFLQLSNLSVLLRLPSVTPCFPTACVPNHSPCRPSTPKPCRLNVAMQEDPDCLNH